MQAQNFAKIVHPLCSIRNKSLDRSAKRLVICTQFSEIWAFIELASKNMHGFTYVIGPLFLDSCGTDSQKHFSSASGLRVSQDDF